MIRLDAVSTRRPRGGLTNVSVAWGPGVHAVVGTRYDGGFQVLAVVAGRVAPRSGSVRVLDGRPTDAGVRERIALVPLEPVLPEALRVDEVLDLAGTVRGDMPLAASERLATLGVETLALRPVRSLSRSEARTVALVEALTSSRVRVALIEEPFVEVDPRAAGRLRKVIRDRAAEGCAVVVATASVGDAVDVADDPVLMRGGALGDRRAPLDLLGGFAPAGARLRIVASDPHALLAALAREPDVEAVARRDLAVIARGKDAVALAAAAGRAAIAAEVDVIEMRLEPPTLEEAKAASAGIEKATYDAAYARTRSSLTSSASQEAGEAP